MGEQTFALTWLGHSSVVVEAGPLRIVADPLLRHRIGALRRVAHLPPSAFALLPSSEPRTAVEPRPPVDAVLVSHLHHDHCDLPSLRALRAPTVIAPPGAGVWLSHQGIEGVTELAPGESIELDGDVRVIATPAEHLGRRPPLGPTATCVGHLVEGPAGPSGRRSAWLAGDTGLFAGMAELASLTSTHRIDVAAIPVWGWGPTIGPGHLDPQGAAEAVARAGVEHAVPVHWGTLHPAFLSRTMRTQLHTPGPLFAEAVARLEAPVRPAVLPIGGRLTLA